MSTRCWGTAGAGVYAASSGPAYDGRVGLVPRQRRRTGGCRRRGWAWGGVGCRVAWFRDGDCVASSTTGRRTADAARSASTRSRTAGATSAAKRRSSSGSSVPRMKVLMPCSRVRAASRSAITAEPPWRYCVAAEDVEHPAHGLRTAPALSAASSMTAFISRQVVGGRRSPGSAASRRRAGRSAAASAACGRRARSATSCTGQRAGVHALDPVVLAVDVDGPVAVHAPDAADDRDRLLQRLDRLAAACDAGRPRRRSRPRTRRRPGRARPGRR